MPRHPKPRFVGPVGFAAVVGAATLLAPGVAAAAFWTAPLRPTPARTIVHPPQSLVPGWLVDRAATHYPCPAFGCSPSAVRLQATPFASAVRVATGTRFALAPDITIDRSRSTPPGAASARWFTGQVRRDLRRQFALAARRVAPERREAFARRARSLLDDHTEEIAKLACSTLSAFADDAASDGRVTRADYGRLATIYGDNTERASAASPIDLGPAVSYATRIDQVGRAFLRTLTSLQDAQFPFADPRLADRARAQVIEPFQEALDLPGCDG